MPRLLRPAIPLEVKCRVVLRQLGELFIDDVIEQHRAHPKDAWIKAVSVASKAIARSHGRLLADRIPKLAELLGCDASGLRLDHNPALGVREKIINRAGVHIGYRPDANDPEFLIYRSAHGHHIKTNVRGDGAQFSDTTLMKRERRRKRKAAGTKRRSRPIAKRKNPWGPKGSRPFQRKR